MRLAAKLVLLFLGGLLLIVGLFSFLTIRQDQHLAMTEHERHAADLAATLRPSIEDAIRKHSINELHRSLESCTSRLQHVRIRWVEFSSRADDSRRPSVPPDMIVMQREITTISMPDATGKNHLYTYVPVNTEQTSDTSAGIEISAPDNGANERIRRSLISSLLALVGVAGLSGIVILVGGVKMVGQPLEQLIAKVHRVGQGDFDSPVAVNTRDELGRLGAALNDMCSQLSEQRDQIQQEAAARIATVQQLRHAERLSMVGRMAAGIAHEIGTPLNVVTGRAELIAGGHLSEQAKRESAQAIQAEAQRITKIVRELLDFARQTTPARNTESLNALIESTASLMESLVTKHGATLSVDVPSSNINAFIDPGQIQQVLTNLIINATQATSENGHVEILLDEVDCKPPDGRTCDQTGYCRIRVRDNGIGISPEDREHIFEPFYTTKDVGEGTGLGLSISHGIVSEHDGWIDAESTVGEGSCFSVYLPKRGGSNK